MRSVPPRRTPGFHRWVLVLFVSACTPDGLGLGDDTSSPDSTEDTQTESVPGAVHPFFREDLVHELGLELSETAWASLSADGSTYVEATLDDGAETLTVGLRIKGWTSSQPLTGKPSFKVDIDRFVEGQRYHDLEAFDLHAELPDAAAISEWIAYRLFRDQGLPASRTGWAWLTLSGADYGFYTIVEKKDDQLVELWWEDREDEARDLHRRMLPLINLKSHAFMRYMLKRRGVFTSLAERSPSGVMGIGEEEKREITILLKAIEPEIQSFPFGPE